MGCPNESTASAREDDDTFSNSSNGFIPKICDKCISSLITSDPSTLEGQQEGAILVIKCITSRDENDFQPQVGDHVQILHFNAGKLVIVKNLRGFLISCNPWANFFPIPYFGKCVCTKGQCRCIYESEEEFYVRLLAHFIQRSGADEYVLHRNVVPINQKHVTR
jgi:hypothetical protein